MGDSGLERFERRLNVFHGLVIRHVYSFVNYEIELSTYSFFYRLSQ